MTVFGLCHGYNIIVSINVYNVLHGKYDSLSLYLLKVGGAHKLQYTFNMAPLKFATLCPLAFCM